MGEPLYIWISRWEDFQHYAPRRDRAPAWIKDHLGQLDDDRYLGLTSKERSVLNDLRKLFALMRGRLPSDTRAISGRLRQRVTNDTLASLNHAGFIQLVSREALDQALEKLYASRAPARSQEESRAEEESSKTALPTEARPGSPKTEANYAPTNGLSSIGRELALTKLMGAIGDDADDGTLNVLAKYTRQLPRDRIAQLAERIIREEPRDRAAYAVAALKNETEKPA